MSNFLPCLENLTKKYVDIPENLTNKKVLLRERKRHTARRVASARYAALSNGWVGGGVPHPVMGGVPLHPDLGQDTPPPTQTWHGVPPRPGTGYDPHQDLGWGTPPPRKCGQTETITFPHPSDAGGKNLS